MAAGREGGCSGPAVLSWDPTSGPCSLGTVIVVLLGRPLDADFQSCNWLTTGLHRGSPTSVPLASSAAVVTLLFPCAAACAPSSSPTQGRSLLR